MCKFPILGKEVGEEAVLGVGFDVKMGAGAWEREIELFLSSVVDDCLGGRELSFFLLTCARGLRGLG